MQEWVWLMYTDSQWRGCILFIYSSSVIQMLLWNRVRESPIWQNDEMCPQFSYWHSVGCSLNVENTCCSKWRGFGFPGSSYWPIMATSRKTEALYFSVTGPGTLWSWSTLNHYHEHWRKTKIVLTSHQEVSFISLSRTYFAPCLNSCLGNFTEA